jgi:molybdate transport system substrate-binding protein
MSFSQKSTSIGNQRGVCAIIVIFIGFLTSVTQSAVFVRYKSLKYSMPLKLTWRDKMDSHRKSFPTVLLLFGFMTLTGLSKTALAGEAKIAIAANFTGAAKEIAASFEHQTGHKAVLIFGSTGKLFAQISHGAPFDVYLAADQKRPLKAENDGLAISGTRFTYAIGKISLYSANPVLIDSTPQILTTNGFAKLAMANPKTAPYGAAAQEVLKKLKLYDKVRSKIVMGENAAQTYQFVMTGNAQLGFVANSHATANKDGSRWLVPSNLYTPIRQDGVLLKHGATNRAARSFLLYLKGQNARAIIQKFGYDVGN